MIVRLFCALLSLASPLSAQGFAGLGTDAEGFSVPAEGFDFDFPTDHGPHPDYRIEWWYLTANLQAADGTAYGVQWTLFRSALAHAAGPVRPGRKRVRFPLGLTIGPWRDRVLTRCA